MYEVDDATTETALVLGEYYRRDDGWKFRAGEGQRRGIQRAGGGLRHLGASTGTSTAHPVPVPAPGGPVPLGRVSKVDLER